MQRTNADAHQQPGQDGAPPGPFRRGRLYQLDGDRGADAAGVPDREIDLAEEDDEDLAHGQDHENSALLKEVDEISRREEHVIGADRLENDGNDEQGEDDRQDTAIPAADAREPGAEPFS